MRYIYYPATAIDDKWLKKAENAKKTASTKLGDESKTYIASRSDVWSSLKNILENLSAGKCWYTEARDTVSYWHVDHYRPKSLYPWLAFEWRNMRLCGGIPNVNKSNSFPLDDEAPRATPANPSTTQEAPLLLDPVRWGDPDLLTFNGNGEPACAKPQDPKATIRVEESVRLLDLGSEKLCSERRAKWRLCERKLKALRGIVEEQRHQANTDAVSHLTDLCRDLDDLYSDDSEYTATAWACARELNAETFIQIARRLAQSAGPAT